MEANQESFLSTSSGSLFTEDSSLLSNYLHHQAEIAGNRLLHHRNSVILLHSKLLSTASAQREEAEVSNPSWLSSSANSIRGGSFTAQKESSESFIAREGSSQALSELDQDRGDSAFLNRTMFSSISCVESSECDEFGAEAKTRIDINRDGFCCNRFSGSVKEVHVCADDRRVLNGDAGVSADNMADCDNGVPKDSTVGFKQRVLTDNTKVFDLLIHAAMLVGFLDDEDDQSHDASPGHAKRTDSVCDAGRGRAGNGFPVHLSSPILKKRVVRRARSAFTKRTGRDLLQRLGISSPPKASEELVCGNVEEDENCTNNLKADHLQQWSKPIQYTRRKSLEMSSESVVACKTDVLKMIHRENENESMREDFQGSLSKASDACNTYLKGVRVRNRQCKIQMKQKEIQVLPTPPDLPCPVSKPFENEVELECFKGLQEVKFARGQKRSVSEEKLDCKGREGNYEVKAEDVACARNGGSEEKLDCKHREGNYEVKAEDVACTMNGDSMIKLKIRPMGSPQKASKSEEFEQVSEGNTITRRSERLRVGESTELLLCDSTDSLDMQAKDGNPLIRSKRGRSQVLPTKFSDSVLQPWKKAYRKK